MVRWQRKAVYGKTDKTITKRMGQAMADKTITIRMGQTMADKTITK
jgi:hypothetical protein